MKYFYRTHVTSQCYLKFGCHIFQTGTLFQMKRGNINNYIRNIGINQTVTGKLGCTGNLIVCWVISFSNKLLGLSIKT